MCTLLLGIPMIILETSFGQYFRSGIMKTWSKVPLFKGIAIACLVCIFHTNTYYIVVLAWVTKYLVSSFSYTLPWSVCGNPWNSENCVQFLNRNTTSNATMHANATNAGINTISAAEEFWTKEVLGKSSGIDDVGSLKPDLVLYLAILWMITYFATFKGIKWSSKVVYVTATLPIILILIVLIRGCLLEGAGDGLYFYLVPKLHKLGELEVWVSAATQVAFSTGIGVGTLVLLGSFNKYNHNFFRDSILIGVVNGFSSFLSGFAVFSALGFMANKLGTTVENVAKSGPGLIFIAYPQSISLLPFPQIWSCIFFVTLLFLGFDSQFVVEECFVNFFIDSSPKIRSIRWHREIVTALMCFIKFLIGLSMLTEGGIYVFEIYNRYAAAGWCVFLICLCEAIAIAWVYGLDIHFEAMKDMLGNFFGSWARTWLLISWKIISPVVCAGIVLFYLFGVKSLKVGDYVYPLWAQCVAHMMSLSSVIFIPGYAAYIKFKSGKSFAELRRVVEFEDKKKKIFDDEACVPLEMS
ncbi:sodium- and chloride-dependent betaine transporter-like isoform X2 [Ciona intestinalis]